MAAEAGSAEAAIRSALYHSRSADDAERGRAEQMLRGFTRVPGYGHCLASVMASQSDPIPLRQLAGLVLRRFVRRYWMDTQATENALGDAEKQAIRDIMPPLLRERSSLLRRAASMVIAAIAAFDFPTAWPSLVTDLLSASAGEDPYLVHGAVQCLALSADEIFDPGNVAVLSPTLFPQLMALFLGTERRLPLRVRTRAASVLHAALRVLAIASDEPIEVAAVPCATPLAVPGTVVQASAAVAPLVRDSLSALLAATSKAAQCASDAVLQTHAVRILGLLLLFFPDAIGDATGRVLQTLFQLMASVEGVYVHHAVLGAEWRADADPAVPTPLPHESAVGGYDSEEGEEEGGRGMGAVASALLGFVEQGLDSKCKPFHAAVSSALPATAHVLIGYMRITREEEEEWEEDPSVFMLDEDENALACTVRQNAQRLVAHLVYRHRAAALRAVGEGAVARVHAAAASRERGFAEWWREQEAALLALGAVARHMRRVQGGGPFDVPSLSRTLQQTAAEGSAPPFLRGRALLCAAKYLRPASDAGTARALFHSALAAMGDGGPPTLRLAACRAVRVICAKTGVGGEGAPAADLGRAVDGVVALLAATEGDTRYHVLLTLHRLFKSAPAAASTMGPNLTPMLARLWYEHVNEPIVLEVVLSCLHALARTPACLRLLQEQFTPLVVQVLSMSPAEDAAGMLGSAVDVARVLIARAPAESLPPAFLDALLPPLFACLNASEESGVMQSGCETLRALVRVAPVQLTRWRCSAGTGGELLLKFMAHALDPQFADAAAMFTGGLALKITVKLCDALPSDLLTAMLRGVFQRMQRAGMPSAQSNLLLVFCRLTASNPKLVLDILAALPGTPPELPADVLARAEERSGRRLAPWYLCGCKSPITVADAPGAPPRPWAPASGVDFFVAALLDSASASGPQYHMRIVAAAVLRLLRENDPRVQEAVVPGSTAPAEAPERSSQRRPVTRSHVQPPVRVLSPAPLALVACAMHYFAAIAEEDDDEAGYSDEDVDFDDLEMSLGGAPEDGSMLLSDMLDGVDGEPMGLGAAGGLGGDEDEKDDDEDDEDDEIAADAAEDELMKSDVNTDLRAMLMDIFKQHGEAFQRAFQLLGPLEQRSFQKAIAATGEGQTGAA